MSKEDLPSPLNGPQKKGVTGLGEAFSALKTMFLGAIAILIAIAENLWKSFSQWQLKAKQEAEELRLQQKEEERVIRLEERKAQEEAKIASEIRLEEKEIRAEERKNESKKLKGGKLIYPILAGFSTLSLIFMVVKLGPIAEWTRNQNECIENSSGRGLPTENEFASKVMRCNGGHD